MNTSRNKKTSEPTPAVQRPGEKDELELMVDEALAASMDRSGVSPHEVRPDTNPIAWRILAHLTEEVLASSFTNEKQRGDEGKGAPVDYICWQLREIQRATHLPYETIVNCIEDRQPLPEQVDDAGAAAPSLTGYTMRGLGPDTPAAIRKRYEEIRVLRDTLKSGMTPYTYYSKDIACLAKQITEYNPCAAQEGINKSLAARIETGNAATREKIKQDLVAREALQEIDAATLKKLREVLSANIERWAANSTSVDKKPIFDECLRDAFYTAPERWARIELEYERPQRDADQYYRDHLHKAFDALRQPD